MIASLKMELYAHPLHSIDIKAGQLSFAWANGRVFHASNAKLANDNELQISGHTHVPGDAYRMNDEPYTILGGELEALKVEDLNDTLKILSDWTGKVAASLKQTANPPSPDQYVTGKQGQKIPIWHYKAPHDGPPPDGKPVLTAVEMNQKTVQDIHDVWGENETYPRADWKYQVSNGDTNLGYWDWVSHCIERDLLPAG
jgi:hypothetical protein